MKKILIFSILGVLFLNINFCFAAAAGANLPPAGGNQPASQNKTQTQVNLPNPLGKTITIPQLIAKVISALLGIIGALALLMIIYGGFTWMTSAGSPEGVTKGKNIIIWASIGMLIVFTSYTLVKYLLQVVTGT